MTKIPCRAPNCRNWFYGVDGDGGSAMVVHYMLEHDPKECDYCGQQFAGNLKLDQHHTLEHAVEPAAEDDDDVLVKCVKCGLVFTYEEMVVHDADYHMNDEPPLLVDGSNESQAWSTMAAVDFNEPPPSEHSFDYGSSGGEEVGFSCLSLRLILPRPPRTSS